MDSISACLAGPPRPALPMRTPPRRRPPAILFLVAVLSLLGILGLAVSAAAEVPVPPLTGRVVDLTGALTREQADALDQRLRAFEESKGAQVVVLVVPTTRPEELEQFSIRVAEAWKIGRAKSDDGAILLVALQDRALRIEVGYGLEGALTDLVSKRIVADIITPHFQAGDIPGGIAAGVDAMLKVIEGEPLPPPERRPGSGAPGGLGQLLPFLILFAFVIGSAVRAIFGRFLGGFLGGGGAGLVGSLFTGSILLGGLIGVAAFFLILFGGSLGRLGGRRRGGFMGGMGGFGDGGGFRGGGFGGFSGGGGGFGGGGASGRW